MTAPEAARGPALTILLAEDDLGYQFLISTLLTDAGHQVIAVNDGEGLMKRWPEADVLVVDVRLPTGGTYEGIKVATRIRGLPEGKGKPIVFISALSELECQHVLHEFSGPFVWLQKPFSVELLLDAIAKAQRQLRRDAT